MVKFFKKLYFKIFMKNNEFHKSLDLDIKKMSKMNKEEQKEYCLNLVKRRNYYHNLDME